MFIKTETGQQQAWILCCPRDPCQYARFQWRQFGFACCNVVKPRPWLPALRWLPGQSFHRVKGSDFPCVDSCNAYDGLAIAIEINQQKGYF